MNNIKPGDKVYLVPHNRFDEEVLYQLRYRRPPYTVREVEEDLVWLEGVEGVLFYNEIKKA